MMLHVVTMWLLHVREAYAWTRPNQAKSFVHFEGTSLDGLYWEFGWHVVLHVTFSSLLRVPLMIGGCLGHAAPPCWKNPLIFAYKNPTRQVGPTTVGPFLPRVGFCQVSSHRTNAVPDRPCPPVPTWHVRSFVHLSEMQRGETMWNMVNLFR